MTGPGNGLRQVHGHMTLAEAEDLAREYGDLLTRNKVPFTFERTFNDITRRIAELNHMSREEWLATQKEVG